MRAVTDIRLLRDIRIVRVTTMVGSRDARVTIAVGLLESTLTHRVANALRDADG